VGTLLPSRHFGKDAPLSVGRPTEVIAPINLLECITGKSLNVRNKETLTMVRFQIQKELQNDWTKVLRDHANLFLAPLQGHFGNATITLQLGKGSNLPAPGNTAPLYGEAPGTIYSCSIGISGFDTIVCDHPDPHIAIGQVMARARRSLARQARMRDTLGL
jgi:hypothetical protein